MQDKGLIYMYGDIMTNVGSANMIPSLSVSKIFFIFTHPFLFSLLGMHFALVEMFRRIILYFKYLSLLIAIPTHSLPTHSSEFYLHQQKLRNWDLCVIEARRVLNIMALKNKDTTSNHSLGNKVSRRNLFL